MVLTCSEFLIKIYILLSLFRCHSCPRLHIAGFRKSLLNFQHFRGVDYFRKKVPSQMFNWVLNMPLHFTVFSYPLTFQFTHLLLSSVRTLFCRLQKHPSRGVLIKRRSENIQQIYRGTLIWKCDFNKIAQHTFTWVFSCKFAAYFQNTFY